MRTIALKVHVPILYSRLMSAPFGILDNKLKFRQPVRYTSMPIHVAVSTLLLFESGASFLPLVVLAQTTVSG